MARKLGMAFLLAGSVFLTSCAELLVLGAAAGAGGYVGYKAAKEGYSVEVEPPVKIKKKSREEDF